MDNVKLNNAGRNGRPEHGRILSLLRQELIPILRHRGFPLSAISLNQNQMAGILGNKSGLEGLYPDALVFEKYVPTEELEGKHSKEYVLIEVGDYKPDKWDDTYSVIHIGFNKKVTPLLSQYDTFELELLKSIKEILAGDFTFALEGKTLDELRKLVILALAGIGLSNPQINRLKWVNVLETKENTHIIIHDIIEEKLELSYYTIQILNTYKEQLIKEGLYISDDASIMCSKRDGHPVTNKIISETIKGMYK